MIFGRKLLNLAEMKRGLFRGEEDTLSKLLFMNADDERDIIQKQRRRHAEYCGLASSQAAIGWVVRDVLHWDTAIIVGGAAFFLSWLLARYREQRRTLDVGSKSRILTDAVESLLLMFLLAIGAIVSLKTGVELLVLQAHLCVFLTLYFIGTWISEMHWRKQNVGQLSSKEAKNYVLNLNRSVIFPYNSTFLRSLFRK